MATRPRPAPRGKVDRLTAYCWRNCSHMARPLTSQCAGDEKSFTWTEDMGRAFNTIIAELSKQPQLHLPDASKPFVIFTDASDVAKGPMLEQDGHPIAFDSSSLNKHEKNYDLRQKELLAIVRACRRWRHYLACVPVTVYTDHRTLTTFLDNHDLTDTTGRLCRWQEFCPKLTSPSSTTLTRTTRQRMRSADSHRSRSQWQPRQQRPQRSGTCRPRSWMRFAPLTPRTLTSMGLPRIPSVLPAPRRTLVQEVGSERRDATLPT